jgi:hypothetical protein
MDGQRKRDDPKNGLLHLKINKTIIS